MQREPSDSKNPISKVFSRIFGGDRKKDEARPGTPGTRTAAGDGPARRTAPPSGGATPTAGVTPGATRPDPQAGRPLASAAPASSTSKSASSPDFSNVRGGSSTAPATPSNQPRTHTVERGDTLSKIAQQVYGRADRWKLIFDANRNLLDDPDRIHPGQVLVLPDAPRDS